MKLMRFMRDMPKYERGKTDYLKQLEEELNPHYADSEEVDE